MSEESKFVVGNKSMSDRLKNIEVTLDHMAYKKTKVKGFKLPKFSGWKAKLKKNYCVVEIIKANGSLDFKMLQIEDDVVRIPFNDTYHVATINYMLQHKGLPFLIIPEWSLEPLNLRVKPFDPQQHLEQTVKDNNLALPEKIIITQIKKAQAGLMKKQFGGKALIWIGVLVVAGLYLLSKFFPGLGGG